MVRDYLYWDSAKFKQQIFSVNPQRYMVILGSLIPSRTGKHCSVDDGSDTKRPKCGLLKLNDSILTCHQEVCNQRHHALCQGNIIVTS